MVPLVKYGNRGSPLAPCAFLPQLIYVSRLCFLAPVTANKEEALQESKTCCTLRSEFTTLETQCALI